MKELPGAAWLARGLTMSETARVNRLDPMIAASCAVALVAARRWGRWTL